VSLMGGEEGDLFPFPFFDLAGVKHTAGFLGHLSHTTLLDLNKIGSCNVDAA